MPALAALEAARSRVYGLESAIAERIVILLDKLSRSTIHPYVMADVQNNLTQNAFTSFDADDLRNKMGGPFVITRLRVYTTAGVDGSNAGAIFSNVAFRIEDLEGHHVFTRFPVLLPTLFSLNDNTWHLDRPYVLERGSSLFVQAQEQNVNGTTDVHLAVHGEVVQGNMLAPEVEEAIGFGIYPMAGRQLSVFDSMTLFDLLLGSRPPRLKGEVADLLEGLRRRTMTVWKRLADADFVAFIARSTAANITRNAETLLNRDDFRNPEGGAYAVSRVRCFTIATQAAAAAGAVEDNVATSLASTDERIALTPDEGVLNPVLFSRDDNTWMFDHPLVVRRNGSLQFRSHEQNVDGVTDVFYAALGEAVRGVEHDDLRFAVSLGLYPLMERARN